MPDDDDDPGIIGRINLDVSRWLRPQPDPTLCALSRPVATAGINFATLHNVEHAVRVVLDHRRSQGIGWYGAEVHSHNGHDALAHSLQEAVDGYYYATQARLEHDSPDTRDLCVTWLQLVARMVHMLDVRDNGLADHPTEEWVGPTAEQLEETPRSARPTIPPLLTRRCCVSAAKGQSFECDVPGACEQYGGPPSKT